MAVGVEKGRHVPGPDVRGVSLASATKAGVAREYWAVSIGGNDRAGYPFEASPGSTTFQATPSPGADCIGRSAHLSLDKKRRPKGGNFVRRGWLVACACLLGVFAAALQDLFDAAKKAPGTIRAATTGILSDDHLAILMAEEAVPGGTYRIVHLAGGAAQFKEIMAGNIDVAFDNVGSIVPRVKSGEVRALAVMDNAHSKSLPEVPTTKELGFPTVYSNSTRGIAGPKGMPEPIVKKLQEVLRKAMDNPEHIKKLEDQGIAIEIMVGEEYAQYFADAHAKAKKYTEWAKNRPQK
jgi:hypothetical protein